MRIGISIMTGNKQHVWNNGLVQNIYHFAALLRKIPFVEQVYLINCGDQDCHPNGSDDEAKSLPLVRAAEALDLIDVGIEMGGAVDVEWIRRLRFQGGKFILHLCGQPYVSLIEPTIFGRQGFFIEAQRAEEIWLLAKDMIFAPMLRTIHRCPVYEVPYLWAPRFLEQTIETAEDGGPRYGYRRGSLKRGTARPAIFEPNLSPIKMGLIPYMICDAVERRSPGMLEDVTYLNGDGMMTHPTFVHFMRNSAVYQAGKARITGRDYFAHVMGRGSNIVVSHQINCPQNYVYLDALHGSYPLIHNSPLFKEAGYYYEASDVTAGAQALRQAIETHDDDLDAYSERAKGVVDALSPSARLNVDHYARRLVALTSASATRRSA
ncbi:DUF2827 family protein [Methylobacterium komagatae]|uniref:DUF2827 family protein n=1 Tax=Methylobacterium komagatae TaxID=374425 RepID=A0ABW2BJ40_9HYPH